MSLFSVPGQFGLASVFLLFRAARVSYRSSQARGWIGAAATGLYHNHSNAESKHVINLHHSSRQCKILNPLSKARDRTHIFMDASQIHFCCATRGTSGLAPYRHLPPLSFHLLLSERLGKLSWNGSLKDGDSSDFLLFHLKIASRGKG